MFWVIDKNIRRRGIEVRLNTPVMKLIRGPENGVRGVVLGGDGEGSGSRRGARWSSPAAASKRTRR